MSEPEADLELRRELPFQRNSPWLIPMASFPPILEYYCPCFGRVLERRELGSLMNILLTDPPGTKKLAGECQRVALSYFWHNTPP